MATHVLQPTFLQLLMAAQKLLPNKTMLEKTIWLQRTSVRRGRKSETIKTVSPYFRGITLQAHASGWLTASVHVYTDAWIAYVSIPMRIKATVNQPFRCTVYADAILPMVKLLDKHERIDLRFENDKLEMVQGLNTCHLTTITQSIFYDQAYAEATKPAPVVIQPIIVKAPLMLAAPKIAGLLPANVTSVCVCELCHQQTMTVKLYGPLNHMLCFSCYSQVMAYEGKVQARIERLNAYAAKSETEAHQTYNHARKMGEAIPFGQPILIGHHSERADRRYRERIFRTYGRAFEKFEQAADYERRAKAAEKNRAISSDDPTAILKLQEKLEKLTEQQAEMVRLNKFVRKVVGKVERLQSVGHHGTVAEINARFRAEQDRVRAIHKTYAERAPELATLAGITEDLAVKLLTPDFMGRVGIPDYATKNNGAEIRRLQKRIDDLEARRTTVAENAQRETHGDVTLERCAKDNRLRLMFPSKPAPQIIHSLKQNGFHWSRQNQAWQRQLNATAEWAAQRVLNTIKEQIS